MTAHYAPVTRCNVSHSSTSMWHTSSWNLCPSHRLALPHALVRAISRTIRVHHKSLIHTSFGSISSTGYTHIEEKGEKTFISCTWKCVSIWALYLFTNGLLIIIFACISKPTIMSHRTQQTDANISDFIAGVPRLNLGQHTKKFKMRPLHCLKTSDQIRQERRSPDLLNILGTFHFKSYWSKATGLFMNGHISNLDPR
jgi:hypothetical protein